MFSAVSPRLTIGYSAFILGFSNRQPTVVSNILGWPWAGTFSGLGIAHGARLIDSMPLPMQTSASPAMIVWAASLTADSADAQLRFMVTPGTSTGNPASSVAMRATSRLSSPPWLPQPA